MRWGSSLPETEKLTLRPTEEFYATAMAEKDEAVRTAVESWAEWKNVDAWFGRQVRWARLWKHATSAWFPLRMYRDRPPTRENRNVFERANKVLVDYANKAETERGPEEPLAQYGLARKLVQEMAEKEKKL